MDYKQKYEEALKRAMNYHKGHTVDVNLQAAMEYVFPELKENEDEKISKEIIKYLQYSIVFDKVFLDKKYNWSQKDCSKWISWLEKQGEQKPVDKVEPKFKVGDWIVNSEGKLRHIVNVDNIGYQTNNGWLSHKLYENIYHLWTIQDAKNGDILQANKCTLIFDSLTKDIDGNTVISSWYYCDTKTFYGMGTCKPDLWTIEGVVPATKEECDLLFSKMKEAGYEWDAEKKELKKLEQKPDFCHHEVDLSNCSEEYRKAYYDGWNNCNQQHAQLEAEQKPIGVKRMRREE